LRIEAKGGRAKPIAFLAARVGPEQVAVEMTAPTPGGPKQGVHRKEHHLTRLSSGGKWFSLEITMTITGVVTTGAARGTGHCLSSLAVGLWAAVSGFCVFPECRRVGGARRLSRSSRAGSAADGCLSPGAGGRLLAVTFAVGWMGGWRPFREPFPLPPPSDRSDGQRCAGPALRVRAGPLVPVSTASCPLGRNC